MSIFMLILWIAILLLVIADDISSRKSEAKDLSNKLMMAKMIEYLAVIVIILLELENVLE